MLLIGALSLGVVAMHQLAGPAPSSHSAAAMVGQHAPSLHDETRHGAAHDEPAAHSTGTTAASSSSNSAGHSSDHDHLLHLCLAILSAIIMALGTWLLTNPWLRAATSRFTRRAGWNTALLRPPRRPHGFALLLSLGVMRT
nr:DUF6153 family protein [Phytoactinopolyspora mesophila]